MKKWLIITLIVGACTVVGMTAAVHCTPPTPVTHGHKDFSAATAITAVTVDVPMTHVSVVYGDSLSVDYTASKVTTTCQNQHLSVTTGQHVYVNTRPGKKNEHVTVTIPRGTALDKLRITAAGITLPEDLHVQDCHLDNKFCNSRITKLHAQKLSIKNHLADIQVNDCQIGSLEENTTLGKIKYHNTEIDQRD